MRLQAPPALQLRDPFLTPSIAHRHRARISPACLALAPTNSLPKIIIAPGSCRPGLGDGRCVGQPLRRLTPFVPSGWIARATHLGNEEVHHTGV